MANLSRRSFLIDASAAALAAAARPVLAATHRERVFIGSNTQNGVLAYDWDPAAGELAPAGVAAELPTIDWLCFSPDRKYIFAAAELDHFLGKPTGGVVSFALEHGSLRTISQVNSASKGTCHVAVDKTGRVLVSADYGGGSAASFQVSGDGKVSEAVWTEHYTAHGPNKDRQEAAHAHFASFSPDNRFAYVNDLGGDCIHIYQMDSQTAKLAPAGQYSSQPGAGPRTLHFHPNGHTAYSMNEINSTVDVLEWHRSDGSLTRVTTVALLPGDDHQTATGCDTIISKDGRFVYFIERGDEKPAPAGSFDANFLYAFKADVKSGALTPIGRTPSGGATPRNATLDPSERWMLVANQNSDRICVFARNVETGELASQGKSFAAKVPMRILFA